MGRIPRHQIDDIRDRTDLVGLVQRHVRLQARGNSHVGLCPFHQEKTPSFHVVPHKKIFHCFGCGAGGDCFKFLMEIEGLSFIEAVRELAQAAGVSLEQRELTPAERRRLDLRANIHGVLDTACAFWEAVLWTRPEAAEARAYLEGRGIDQETARTWRLGYAPPGWTTTLDRLQRERIPVGLLLDAGLAKRSQKTGGTYDTFRDRITIPIADERGRIIAFGARRMGDEGPKYLNSPETEVYVKKKVLFGLHHARRAIQQQDRALLVEGYFDVISLHQAGFQEAIATCGTALTPDHLVTLRRLTRTAVALFDADEAGARAAEKSLPLFMEADVLPFRLDLPGAKDPDELIQEEGPGAMEVALGHRTPLLEWVIDRKVARAGGGSAARGAVLDEILDLLALTEGTDIIARVAARLRMHEVALRKRVEEARRRRRPSAPRPRDPAAITDQVRDGGAGPPPDAYDDIPPPDDEGMVPDGPPPGPEDGPVQATPRPPTWRPTRDHVHLLWLLVHRPDSTVALARPLAPLDWIHAGPATPIYERLLDREDPAAILADLERDDLVRVLRAVMAREALYTPDQAPTGMAQVLDRLLRPHLDRALGTLAEANRRAVAQEDWGALRETTTRQKALRELRQSLKANLKGSQLDDWLDGAVHTLDAARALL